MGSKVTVPPPTAEENALRVEQTNLLRDQRQILLEQQKMNSALLPVFATQLGLTLKRDKKGNIIGATQTDSARRTMELQQQITEKTLNDLLHPEKNPTYQKQQRLLDLQLQQYEDEMSGPLAQQDKEIRRLSGERTLKALRGELEVDPAVERDLKNQEQTLRERLQQQLGSGYETSSAGQEALQRYREGADVLRSQARRGEMTLSEQLAASRAGIDLAQGQANIAATGAKLPGVDPLSSGGFAFGVGQGGLQNQATLRQVLASPLGIAGGIGQVAAGYQMPIGQLMQQRQMELNASIQNSQNSMAGLGALGSVFGAILGMSDERAKDELEEIGEYNGIPIYAYTLKHSGERKIGVLAQDLERIRPGAVRELAGWKLVNYGVL